MPNNNKQAIGTVALGNRPSWLGPGSSCRGRRSPLKLCGMSEAFRLGDWPWGGRGGRAHSAGEPIILHE